MSNLNKKLIYNFTSNANEFRPHYRITSEWYIDSLILKLCIDTIVRKIVTKLTKNMSITKKMLLPTDDTSGVTRLAGGIHSWDN